MASKMHPNWYLTVCIQIIHNGVEEINRKIKGIALTIMINFN